MQTKKKNSHENISSLFQEGKWREIVNIVNQDIKAGKSSRDDPRILNIAGAAARNLRELKLAEEFWTKAHTLDPNNPDIINNLGVALREGGRHKEALEYFIKASEISSTANIYNNIGVSFYYLKRYNEAINAYKKALDENPNFAEAWANLGNSLKDTHRNSQAERAFEQALMIRPTFAWALSCLAHIKQKLTKQDEAVNLIDKALHLDPNNAEIQLTALNVRLPLKPSNENEGGRYVDEFKNQLEILEKWAKKNKNLISLGERVGYSQPYFIAYRRGNHKDLLGRYGRLMANAAAAYRKLELNGIRGKPKKHTKIRIVFVSGFIYRHSVWDIITKGFAAHLDRSKFEVTIIHTGATVDAETKLASSIANNFHQGPYSHHELLSLVLSIDPQVIFYPEIGMDPYSMHLASLRLAPLQLTSWGHPITSGLPTIDWYISGDLLEPTDAHKHYSERLVKLPNNGICTSALSFAPQSIIFKTVVNDFNEKVRFYVCQHAFKFTDDAIDLLTEVCIRIKNAVLVMVKDEKYPDAYKIAMDRLTESFTKSKLNHKTRIFNIPWLSREKFLGSFKCIDIYLDLPGFSGYTTAWQAVSQGTPVITLEGDFLRQRLASGILKRLGMTELIASTSQEYVEIAVMLAKERELEPVKFENRRLLIQSKYAVLDNDTEPVLALENKILSHFNYEIDQTSISRTIEKKNINNIDPKDRTTAEKAFLILQLSDLDHLVQNRQVVNQLTLVAIDAFLMERAHSLGFTATQLRRVRIQSDFQIKILSRAVAESTLLDLRLSEIRESCFDDIPHPGWDGALFALFLIRAYTIRYLARSIKDSLKDFSQINVFAPTNPQYLYFDSSIPPELLSLEDQKFNIISRYAINQPAIDAHTKSTFNFKKIRDEIHRNNKINALVHIPTCFHHKDQTKSFIENIASNYIELPSPIWDVPINRKPGETHFVSAGNSEYALNPIVLDYHRQAFPVWKEALQNALGAEFNVSNQANFFSEISKNQAITYMELRGVINNKIKLIIADHELGMRGPLFSAARHAKSQIYILPHSTVTSPLALLPHSENVTLIQGVGENVQKYSIHGEKINISVNEGFCRTRIGRTSTKNNQKDRRTLCLLLNQIYSNGMFHVDVFALRELHEFLKSFCDKREINYIIRPKISGLAPKVLSNIFGASQNQIVEWAAMPLADFIEKTDICVNFGELSSATIEFRQNNSIVLGYDSHMYSYKYLASADTGFDYFYNIESLEHHLSSRLSENPEDSFRSLDKQ